VEKSMPKKKSKDKKQKKEQKSSWGNTLNDLR